MAGEGVPSDSPLAQKNLIRLSRSIVGAEELKAVSRVMLGDSYLGMGPEVQMVCPPKLIHMLS
jgi:hypothetical protein